MKIRVFLCESTNNWKHVEIQGLTSSETVYPKTASTKVICEDQVRYPSIFGAKNKPPTNLLAIYDGVTDAPYSTSRKQVEHPALRHGFLSVGSRLQLSSIANPPTFLYNLLSSGGKKREKQLLLGFARLLLSATKWSSQEVHRAGTWERKIPL